MRTLIGLDPSLRDQDVMRIDAGALCNGYGARERPFVEAAIEEKSVFEGMRGGSLFARPRGARLRRPVFPRYPQLEKPRNFRLPVFALLSREAIILTCFASIRAKDVFQYYARKDCIFDLASA
ncbi:MAG: hypothetical protein ACR2J1_10825 [Methyloceanibacter sp.]|uniref:hypothetical protein n=1 Tax=Methyloceanibacter sp. TaxID=1965321 RepID=UPI003D9B3250